ncbi:MAG: LysR family transcriptional regulator [Gammaproteobacteria bacterium]|nr:LysR family transcriptional regulator [Gammaproteobacteria bacterium]
MYRSLDLVYLRTLIAVAETGGMTRAANLLHMTQSTVSMQMKRLEEQLSVQLLKRDGRKIVATPEGARLISYAKRLVEINNEAVKSLAEPLYDVSINCGVAGDILYPFMPELIQRFEKNYPRLGFNVKASFSSFLRRGLKNGLYDVIFTTELAPSSEGGIALMQCPLHWVGKPGGESWTRTPLPISMSHNCMFKKPACDVLDAAGIEWVDIIQEMNDTSALLTCAADKGVRAELSCYSMRGIEAIDHGGRLPELPDYTVFLYFSPGLNRELAEEFERIASEVFQ